MGFISDWGEAIIFSLAFVASLTLVIGSLNTLYGDTKELPLSDNTTLSSFQVYTNTSLTDVQGGEVNYDAQNGLNLKTSYKIMTGFLNICWNFISGSWISQVANMIGLGEALNPLIIGLQVLWFVSLVFGILYVLFKVKP